MSDNPYSTPSAALDVRDHADSRKPTQTSTLRLANTKQRVLTLILDLVFGYVLLMFLKGLLTSLSGSLNFLNTFVPVYYLLGYFLYYVVLESVWAYTLGKLVAGTRVVSKTGGTPTFSQILIRSACRYIPFEFLSFFFKQTQPGKPVGWHDQFSATRVIDTRYI